MFDINLEGFYFSLKSIEDLKKKGLEITYEAISRSTFVLRVNYNSGNTLCEITYKNSVPIKYSLYQEVEYYEASLQPSLQPSLQISTINSKGKNSSTYGNANVLDELNECDQSMLNTSAFELLSRILLLAPKKLQKQVNRTYL